MEINDVLKGLDTLTIDKDILRDYLIKLTANVRWRMELRVEAAIRSHRDALALTKGSSDRAKLIDESRDYIRKARHAKRELVYLSVLKRCLEEWQPPKPS